MTTTIIIAAASALFCLVAGVCACMLSSRISQDEEQRGK